VVFPSWLIADGILWTSQKSQERGDMVLALHYIVSLWWYRVRVNHSLLSIFAPPLDEMLVITRAQRVATLAVGVLANMATSAIFFFSAPASSMQVAIAGLLSGVAMLPFTDTFPYLFEKINTYQSYTVEMREGLQEKYQEQKKAREAAVKELQKKLRAVYKGSRPGKTRVPAVPFDELPAIMRGEKTFEGVIREVEEARQAALRYQPERLSASKGSAPKPSPTLTVETDGLVVLGTEGVYQRSIPQRRDGSSIISPRRSPLSPVQFPVQEMDPGSVLQLPPRIHLPSPAPSDGGTSPELFTGRVRSRSRRRALSPTALANMHAAAFAPRVVTVNAQPKRRSLDDSDDVLSPRPHRARTLQLPAYKLRGDWVNSDVLLPSEDASDDDDALVKLAKLDRSSPRVGTKVTTPGLRQALTAKGHDHGN
jgi:hypothetical protein